MDPLQPLDALRPSPVPDSLGVDWFGRRGGAVAVLTPATVDEVAQVLSTCAVQGVSVVPIGGNTGLVGGTLAPAGSVLLSTARLRRIDVDHDQGTATVGAGVTLGDLAAALRGTGWEYGVDLASRSAATIGGTIATNAGGIAVCRYGMTADQVLGLEVVQADGTVLTDLRGLPKDNTGYRLRELFVGSEGTLGVVTAALVRLHRRAAHRVSLACGTGSLAATAQLGRALAGTAPLLACEVVDAQSWRSVVTARQLRDPLPQVDTPYVAVFAVDAADPTVLEPLLDHVDHVALATDSHAADDLWAPRELQADWWNQVAAEHPGTRLHKYDVTIPMPVLDDAVRQLRGLLDRQALAAGVFGHVYEGSLHVQACGPPEPVLDESVLRLVSTLGGSLSAEHGVGRDKAQWLHLRRSPTELATMRSIKAALDPAGIMNPGTVLVED